MVHLRVHKTELQIVLHPIKNVGSKICKWTSLEDPYNHNINIFMICSVLTQIAHLTENINKI